MFSSHSFSGDEGGDGQRVRSLSQETIRQPDRGGRHGGGSAGSRKEIEAFDRSEKPEAVSSHFSTGLDGREKREKEDVDMAVLQMQRISICAMKKNRKAILERLQELGAWRSISRNDSGYRKRMCRTATFESRRRCGPCIGSCRSMRRRRPVCWRR